MLMACISSYYLLHIAFRYMAPPPPPYDPYGGFGVPPVQIPAPAPVPAPSSYVPVQVMLKCIFLFLESGLWNEAPITMYQTIMCVYVFFFLSFERQ